MPCLFCQMVSRQIPSQVIFETEHVLAFKDIHPQAPVHALVIPKEHIAGIHDAVAANASVLGEVMLAARNVAEDLRLGAMGYRLVVNQGEHAGQSVPHLHVHVLGGRKLAWPPG